MSIPSRRAFLASSAAAAASPLAMGAPSRTRRGREDVLRIGLVGCGGRGTGAANQALRTEGAVRLVALADAFADRLERSLQTLSRDGRVGERVDVPKENRFVGFEAYRKLMALDLDVVILATPPHFRPAHFEAAVEAGHHVFMEKPVAVDGAGVRRVLAAGKVAKAKALSVVVGLQRHYQNGYLAAVQRIHEGMIGRVVAARVAWNGGELWSNRRQQGWSDMEFQMRNWLYYTWLSGDHIVEQHVHNIDVANWVIGGYPVRARGLGGRQVRTDPLFGHIYDHHAVQFEYEDGPWVFSTCRQINGCHNEVIEHFLGEGGEASFNTRNWRIAPRGFSEWKYDGPGNNPYQSEHDALFAAIRKGERLDDVEHGARSTASAIMGREATYTGRLVTMEEVLAQEPLGPRAYAFGDLPMPPVPMPGRKN